MLFPWYDFNVSNEKRQAIREAFAARVPKADMVKVATYESSPECAAERIAQWDREAANLATEAATIGDAW